jgi:hypothetical protein
MGLSLMNMFGLSSSVHFTHTACYWTFLPFALHTSPLSVQALQSRSCLSYTWHPESWNSLLYITSSRTAEKTPPSTVPLLVTYFPCVSLCKFIPSSISLLGNCSITMFHCQLICNNIRIAGLVIFYAVRVVSKESRRFVRPQISCLILTCYIYVDTKI